MPDGIKVVGTVPKSPHYFLPGLPRSADGWPGPGGNPFAFQGPKIGALQGNQDE